MRMRSHVSRMETENEWMAEGKEPEGREPIFLSVLFEVSLTPSLPLLLVRREEEHLYCSAQSLLFPFSVSLSLLFLPLESQSSLWSNTRKYTSFFLFLSLNKMHFARNSNRKKTPLKEREMKEEKCFPLFFHRESAVCLLNIISLSLKLNFQTLFSDSSPESQEFLSYHTIHKDLTISSVSVFFHTFSSLHNNWHHLKKDLSFQLYLQDVLEEKRKTVRFIYACKFCSFRSIRHWLPLEEWRQRWPGVKVYTAWRGLLLLSPLDFEWENMNKQWQWSQWCCKEMQEERERDTDGIWYQEENRVTNWSYWWLTRSREAEEGRRRVKLSERRNHRKRGDKWTGKKDHSNRRI